MSGRRRLSRLLSALLRGRSAHLAAAAALIAVAMAFVFQTGARALDEARGGVLYVGAPSVSYPSARNAGAASREYMDTASRETLLALGVTEGEMSSHAARLALSSISHPPEEGAESVTEEAALRAGEDYLAQVGRSAWGGSDTQSEDDSDEQLASYGTERIRPELGDGRTAPEENSGDETDDGGEGSDDDSLVEGELNADPAQLEGGEGGQAPSEYASMEPAGSEPDISQAEKVESSPAVVGDALDEESELPDETTGGGAEAPEASDEAPQMEFATLAAPLSELEGVAPAFPDDEGVLSERATPLPDSAPEPLPVETPLLQDSPEEPTPEESPPPAVLAVAPPPPPKTPEAQDDSWAVVSTVVTSVEVAAGGIETGEEPPASPPPSDPSHRPPVPEPHEPAAPNYMSQPEEERPTPTPAESPDGDHSGSPVDEEPSQGKPEQGVEQDSEDLVLAPPPDAELEMPPENGQPTPDPEDDGSSDSKPVGEASAPPSPRSRPSGDTLPSPATNGGDSPEGMPASNDERRAVSQGEASVPDVDRAMIRLRPSVRDGSAGYAVERILPGRTVEPIYEGDIDPEEAVAIGVVAGGVPPEDLRPAPAILTDAAAELATRQSNGQGAAASGTAPADTAANPSGPVGSEGARPFIPAFIQGEAGDPIGVAEPSEAPQTTSEFHVSQPQTTVSQSTPYHQDQTTPDPFSAIPTPYGQTVSEQSMPTRTAPAETAPTQTVSEQAVSGQAAIESPIVEAPAPYQPTVRVMPEEQILAPDVQSQAVQPQQTQPPSQGIQAAQEVPTVPAAPAAPLAVETPAPPQPTSAYTTPPATSPEPRQTGWAGRPQVVEQQAVEQQVSMQPAASTNTQTNIQTNQTPIDGSIRNIASPGGKGESIPSVGLPVQ